MPEGQNIRVVGGGIIGMSIAWQLSKTGAQVTVYDAGRIGNEASWAGAGMLAPGGEINQPGRFTDLALESLQIYPAFVDELSRESGIAIDFRQRGAFSLAFTEEETEQLRSLVTRQNQMGIYSEQFSPARVPGVRGGAIAAQHYPQDSVVNPRDLLRALISVCRRAGVTLKEFEPVREITRQSPFDLTVIAAGAWSNQLMARLPKVSPCADT